MANPVDPNRPEQHVSDSAAGPSQQTQTQQTTGQPQSVHEHHGSHHHHQQRPQAHQQHHQQHHHQPHEPVQPHHHEQQHHHPQQHHQQPHEQQHHPQEGSIPQHFFPGVSQNLSQYPAQTQYVAPPPPAAVARYHNQAPPQHHMSYTMQNLPPHYQPDYVIQSGNMGQPMDPMHPSNQMTNYAGQPQKQYYQIGMPNSSYPQYLPPQPAQQYQAPPQNLYPQANMAQTPHYSAHYSGPAQYIQGSEATYLQSPQQQQQAQYINYEAPSYFGHRYQTSGQPASNYYQSNPSHYASQQDYHIQELCQGQVQYQPAEYLHQLEPTTSTTQKIDGKSPKKRLLDPPSSNDHSDSPVSQKEFEIDRSKLPRTAHHFPQPMIASDYHETALSDFTTIDSAGGSSLMDYETASTESWCSILYYEYDVRLGDQFTASQPIVTVDGFTDPSSANRFCLGRVANIRRRVHSERARQHIGPGIRMTYDTAKGEVQVECLTRASIFVQSQIHNRKTGNELSAITKVVNSEKIVIFDNKIFTDLLKNARGFEEVFALTHACKIRISFVKGWGPGYRKMTVTETPCWFEVQLNIPLQWTDKILRVVGAPSFVASSLS